MAEIIVNLAWCSVATTGAWMSSQYDILEDRHPYIVEDTELEYEVWSGWDSTYSASLKNWLPKRPSDNDDVVPQGKAELNVECAVYESSKVRAGRAKPDMICHGCRTRDLEYCCRMHLARRGPALWRMQKAITHSGEDAFSHIGLQIPQTTKQPSAEALLLSWVAITLAAVAFCEAKSGHRYRRLVVLGSILVAITIGMAEGMNAHSVALTNIPWCLALGMLADCVVYNIVGAVHRRHANVRQSTDNSECRKEEKKTLA